MPKKHRRIDNDHNNYYNRADKIRTSGIIYVFQHNFIILSTYGYS
jgi:hypothetical protein